ncbi:MAG: hypothetical protein ACTSQE_07185 [Candidatus Heimdallarchaeaceae archaeon]
MSISSAQSSFVLDTNFFISAFEKAPNNFNRFLSSSEELRIELLTSNLIIKELRWYLRRRIQNKVKVIKISMKELRTLHDQLQKKGIPIPQFPDLSNILIAKMYNATVITSDLKLIKACEFTNTPVLMSSSFAILLKERAKSFKVKEFFEKLYDTILSDEIQYSVEQSEIYDPVYRIKKIQLYAIKVLQELPSIQNHTETQTKGTFHLLTEENELLELINEIEFEFPTYLKHLREAHNLEALRVELKDIYIHLIDSTLQLRIALKNKKSSIIDLSIRIKARILFVLSIVEFTLLNLDELESTINILGELAASSPELVSDLFMDLQFLRMVFLLISDNFERLNGYFTENFILLCKTEEREDLVKLTRTIIFAATVIESGLIDKKASLEGRDETSLLIQLGYILLQLKDYEKALLLLLQSHYLAAYRKDIELMRDTLELLIVVHYCTGERITEEIEQGIEDLKAMNIYDLPTIAPQKQTNLDLFLLKDLTKLKEAPVQLQRWFYIYDYTIVSKEEEAKIIIFAINPYFWPKTAIIVSHTLSPYELRPGRQIKIIDGLLTTRIPVNRKLEGHKVDFIIEVKEPKFSLQGPWGMKIIS